MTDIVNLPNNSQNYHRKGLNALQENNLTKAIEMFEKSYELEPSPQVFSELIQLYLKSQNEEKLSQIWEKKYPTLFSRVENEPIALLYALSIKHLFDTDTGLIELYKLKDHFLQEGWDSQIVNNLIIEQNQLNDLSQLISKIKDQEDADQLLETMINMKQTPFLARLKQLYQLKDEAAILVLKAVLKRNDLPHFIKSDVLHYFIYQNKTEAVELYWFGDSYALNTADLVAYKEDKTYQAMIKEIENYCQEENPNLLPDILEYFNLIVMTLYPFIEKAIPDTKSWLKLMLNTFGLDSHGDFAESDNEVNHYLSTAQEEINQLLNL